MGVMTTVKRPSAAGKRVIQTQWVDLEKDGCVKSRLVLKDFNRDHKAHSARDACTDTIDTVTETMLAVSSLDRNNHPERDNIAIAIDVHAAFLHVRWIYG